VLALAASPPRATVVVGGGAAAAGGGGGGVSVGWSVGRLLGCLVGGDLAGKVEAANSYRQQHPQSDVWMDSGILYDGSSCVLLTSPLSSLSL